MAAWKKYEFGVSLYGHILVTSVFPLGDRCHPIATSAFA
jgi:hypothetical protein